MRGRTRDESRRADKHEQPAKPGSGRLAADHAKGHRESIESFVVVFLAFLIWSLEAEGFVIPTGSMAPTLMGRHKEIVCPQCDYVYTVNADREVDLTGKDPSGGHRIHTGVCENCRYQTVVSDAPSFSGDRIYVMKNGVSLPFFPANDRSKLKRWDVTVFKLPEEPEIRYIKRLVGMPNEIIRIQGGDLWRKPLDETTEFGRLRRTLDHQQAMALTVYDDAHRAKALRDDPRWLRWAPVNGRDWSEPVARSFVPALHSPAWVELHYRHLVPSPDQWQEIEAGLPTTPPRRTLITDYNSYNTDLTADDQKRPAHAAKAWFQPHWVGDLTLSCRLTVQEAAGRVRLELIKAGQSNRCEIDLTTGYATLYHGVESIGSPAKTQITHAGTFALTFANVDNRLTLWVDGKLPFDEGTAYSMEPADIEPKIDDLEPARIAARDAAIQIDGLILKRDIYYTLDPAMSDFSNLDGSGYRESSTLFNLLADPPRYASLVHRPPHDYSVQAGRYLMLGDNSPWSRDGRAWGQHDQIDPDLPGRGWDDSGRASWEVPEVLLIGKAFCVYWPHPKPVWPRLRASLDLRLPILPYIERMRWIR